MSSREIEVLKKLKKQRYIRSEGKLKELMCSTLGGHVKGPEDVRVWVNNHCVMDKAPGSKWACGVWDHLSTLLKPDTQIVVHGGGDDDDDELVEVETTTIVPACPLPPTTSMVVMLDVFSRRRVQPPHLRTSPDLVWSLPRPSAPPVFDRNDWFLTNASDLRALLSAPACMDNNLSLVLLKKGKVPKYVTWCARKDINRLCLMVQTGRCVLNSATERGCLTDMDILDEDMGTLIERDVYSVLLLLESYANFYNTRQPYGFNVKETVHPSHQSLMMMGGDHDAVYAYTEWKGGVEEVERACGAVDSLARELRTCIDVLMEKTHDKDMDPVILEAMHDVCDQKHATLASDMKQLKQWGASVRGYETVLRRALTRVKATNMLKSQDPPPGVACVYAKLETVRVDATIERVEACVEGAKLYQERQTALASLGLWGKSLADLSRDIVKAAFRHQVLGSHPDKNSGDVSGQYPQHIKHARDVLLEACV